MSTYNCDWNALQERWDLESVVPSSLRNAWPLVCISPSISPCNCRLETWRSLKSSSLWMRDIAIVMKSTPVSSLNSSKLVSLLLAKMNLVNVKRLLRLLSIPSSLPSNSIPNSCLVPTAPPLPSSAFFSLPLESFNNGLTFINKLAVTHLYWRRHVTIPRSIKKMGILIASTAPFLHLH